MSGHLTKMNDKLSDNELIKRCLDNTDKASWEAFVRRYSKLIWNTIHKTFHTYSFRYSNEDAEDMFNDLFLALINDDFKKLRQFRSDNACSVSTWLTIITSRMTIDFMRKDKSRYIATSLNEETDILDMVPDSRHRADRLIEEWEDDETLNKKIAALSPTDGIIYDLLYKQGFSPEDTAKTMGLSVSAVYTRKHRMIEKFKKHG